MKKKLLILIIFLMSGTCLFSQDGAGNVIKITSRVIRYDSTRTLTNPLDAAPKWYVDASSSDTTAIRSIANQVVIDSFPQMVEFTDTVIGSGKIGTKKEINLKQNILTNPVTGTGTTDYVPKFGSSSIIGNSIIIDDGTNVGIGKTPTTKLDVNGTINAPSINLVTGAVVNKIWQCTNATTGAGQWATVSTTEAWKGTWNASTNTPTLADGTGTTGDYYTVSTSGTANLGSGNQTFAINSTVAYNGTIWQMRPAPSITGAALTKVDDTNVTLTLGGSPSTSLVNATSLTLGWTGTLADSRITSATTWNTVTSKKDNTDSTANTGYTSRLRHTHDLATKQNLLTNPLTQADTVLRLVTQYDNLAKKDNTDSTANTGYTSRLRHSHDLAAKKDNTDSTANTGYTSRLRHTHDLAGKQNILVNPLTQADTVSRLVTQFDNLSKKDNVDSTANSGYTTRLRHAHDLATKQNLLTNPLTQSDTVSRLFTQYDGTLKVDKVTDKALSTNDYTTAEKNKLAGIEAGANLYVHPTGDGNLHVPATGTTSNGMVLTAGPIPGSATWQIANTGSMTYPGAGIALSDGTQWLTSITNNSSNWNTSYSDRLKWDGGSTGLVAATGRTSLGLVIGTDVLAPTGSANSLTNFPILNQNTTGTSTNVTGTVAIANGGTGRVTGTTAYSLIATGTTATGAQQTLANGATTEILVGGGASALPVWTTATGSNAPVRATSPTLVTPILGTPQSGNLANCTFPTLNQSTTGSAAKWTTARTLAGNSVDGSTNVAFTNKFIVQGAADAGLSGAQFLGSLGTGIVKNTTTTGVLSIASAGVDYQAVLTNPVTEPNTGVNGYIVQNSGATSIDTTKLFWNGKLGINTNSPAQDFDLVGNAQVSKRTYIPGTSGTIGQGYYTGSSTTPLGVFQSLDLGGKTYTFFANNKLFNGTTWVDMGQSRVGSSFQIVDDAFTFFSFDATANYTTRLRVASGGNVGIGEYTPTAALHIKAGTATASTAPFKFTPKGSVLLATPERGAFEIDSTDHIYYTIKTGTARKTIAYTDAATTSAAGSMSASDKTKLDGIAAGATAYTHPNGDGNLHVTATGTTNSGKVLTAGSTAGSLSWSNPLQNSTNNGIALTSDVYFPVGIKSGGTIAYYFPGADGPTDYVLATNGVTGLYWKLDATGSGSGMVWPGSGIPISTGSAWGTSITNNSTNWNSAYTYRVTSASGTAPLTLSLSSNGITGSISAATTSVAGSMSAVDKTKLDGIAAGATANLGTVTEVTGTAPIVSSGGTAPAISIAAATQSVTGSMSSTDKTKLDGLRWITPQSITTTADCATYCNFYTTASSSKTITFIDMLEGLSGQIEVSYSGAAVITLACTGYTIKIADNIYNGTTGQVISKSSGTAIYSYYMRNLTIYINGTQTYN